MSAAPGRNAPERARELRSVALPLGLSVACLLAAALAAVARARYGVAGEETRLTWALGVLLATAVLAAAAPGWLVVLWRGRRGAPAPRPASGAVRRAWHRLASAPLAIRVIGLVALALVASLPAASFRNYVRELEFPSLGPLWPLAAGVASASVAAAVLSLLLLGAAVVAAGAPPTVDRTIAFGRWLGPVTQRIRERAAALAPPAWAAHALALAAVAAMGWLAFAPILGTPPLDYDNLFELSATLGSPQSIYPGTPEAFFTMVSAGYRPLPYFSMWAQYQLTGVASEPLFLFNIVAATLCGVVTYLLAHRLTRSVALALGAALLLLVDIRVSSSITQIVTRTQTMACLFGLGALILAYRGRPRSGRVPAGVAVLLFAALLCKEYAAAAVAAVFVLGLLRRGEGGLRLTGAAVGAFALYTAIRIAIDPGGGIEGYCETLGYFFESREACYGRATVSNAIVLTGRAQIYQHLYNVVGGFVAILLPAYFEGDGAIIPYSDWRDTWRVVATPVIFGLALVGWIARPRQTLPLLAMVAGNALTLFLLYRARNVLLGAAGVYVSAAVGLNFLLAWSREKAAARGPGVLRSGLGLLRSAGALALLLLTVAVLVEGLVAERTALEEYRSSVLARPCVPPVLEGEVSDPRRAYFDPEIVRAARAYYGQGPGCPGGP